MFRLRTISMRLWSECNRCQWDRLSEMIGRGRNVRNDRNRESAEMSAKKDMLQYTSEITQDNHWRETYQVCVQNELEKHEEISPAMCENIAKVNWVIDEPAPIPRNRSIPMFAQSKETFMVSNQQLILGDIDI